MRNPFSAIWVVALLLFLAAPFAGAVSITPAYAKMDFQPNAKVEIPFTVAGTEYIEVILEPGDLEGYAWIDDNMPNGTPRMVLLHIQMPEKITKPGKNILYVQAKERNPNPGSVSAVAAIRAPVIVNVPYPGYYAEMLFDTPWVNEGDPMKFHMYVTNLGTDRLENVYGIIDVYDDNGKIKQLTTDRISMEPNTKAEIITDMSTEFMRSGQYRAIGTLYYDGGNSIRVEKQFNIGSLYVKINNFTTELVEGKINRFDIDVESQWNNPIVDMYGTILFEGQTIKTPSFGLANRERAIVSGYIDTANQGYGDHDIKVEIHYGDKSTVQDGKVKIVPQNAPKPAEEEKPSGNIQLTLTPVTILVAVIVLLVLVDAVWLLSRGRQHHDEDRKERRRR